LQLRQQAMATVLLRGGARLAWAYVPRGPVPPTVETVDALVAWARDRRLARLRLDPEAGVELRAPLRDRGFRPSPGPGPAAQPDHTLIVDLDDEKTMLAGFKPKTRYNVRLAERRGVAVEEGLDAAELARQTAATAERQQINLPPRSYYDLLLEKLPWCRTYVARHAGEALAAILVARHDGRAYYLFGGATGRRRELMPTYAVQWEAMRAAAAAGCRDYDLWGIPPEPDPAHPWYGLWQFKTGFGGRPVEYAGAWDLVLSPVRHRLGAVAESARRSLRILKTIRNKRLQRLGA
jgi:lipid II:glycine glycyltransferase (peptidoglycan interpeptide bridge formation enzyme)